MLAMHAHVVCGDDSGGTREVSSILYNEHAMKSQSNGALIEKLYVLVQRHLLWATQCRRFRGELEAAQALCGRR